MAIIFWIKQIFSCYFDSKNQLYKIYQYTLIKQQYPPKAKTSKSHFVFKPHADLPTKQPILFLHLTSYIKCGNQNKNKKIFDVHITSPLLQLQLQSYQTPSASHMQPLFNQVVFAILHVLLNSSTLFHTLSSHIIHIHVNIYLYIQSHSREYLSLQNSYIQSHLHIPLQNIYIYQSEVTFSNVNTQLDTTSFSK